jgi:hypothetical protein
MIELPHRLQLPATTATTATPAQAAQTLWGCHFSWAADRSLLTTGTIFCRGPIFEGNRPFNESRRTSSLFYLLASSALPLACDVTSPSTQVARMNGSVIYPALLLP